MRYGAGPHLILSRVQERMEMISMMNVETATLSDVQPDDPYRTSTGEVVYFKVKTTSRMAPQRGSHPLTCAICGEQAQMILAEKASISRISRRLVYRWIESGALHFIEAPGGEVFVCGRSLVRRLDELAYAPTPFD